MDLKKALQIFNHLKKFDKNFILAGSARRKKIDNLHDLDVIYVGENIPNIPNLQETVRGEKIVRGILNGEQIDIYLSQPDSLGAMLLYLTGSKQYSIKMRAKAKYKGMKLNQNGLFNAKTGELIASKTEESIYKAMGYEYKKPEMRIK